MSRPDASGVAPVDAVLVAVNVVGAGYGPVGALPVGFGGADGFSGGFLAARGYVGEDFLGVVLGAAVQAGELEAAVAAEGVGGGCKGEEREGGGEEMHFLRWLVGR